MTRSKSCMPKIRPHEPARRRHVRRARYRPLGRPDAALSRPFPQRGTGQEKRIEDAATEFCVAADQRDGALAKVRETESATSRAIASLVTHDESVERSAALCGIRASEVRRLRKLSTDTARAANASAKSTAAAVLVKDTTSDNMAVDPVQLSA
jgi:hypothetical protein